jgi:hypothetical protein
MQVNGERLEKLSDASAVSYKTMHKSRDVVQPAPVTMEASGRIDARLIHHMYSMDTVLLYTPALQPMCGAQYCEYVKVGVRRYKVTKGQKLRIKFRLADRGDRLFDSAVYLRNRGLGIRK